MIAFCHWAALLIFALGDALTLLGLNKSIHIPCQKSWVKFLSLFRAHPRFSSSLIGE